MIRTVRKGQSFFLFRGVPLNPRNWREENPLLPKREDSPSGELLRDFASQNSRFLPSKPPIFPSTAWGHPKTPYFWVVLGIVLGMERTIDLGLVGLPLGMDSEFRTNC